MMDKATLRTMLRFFRELEDFKEVSFFRILFTTGRIRVRKESCKSFLPKLESMDYVKINIDTSHGVEFIEASLVLT